MATCLMALTVVSDEGKMEDQTSPKSHLTVFPAPVSSHWSKKCGKRVAWKGDSIFCCIHPSFSAPPLVEEPTITTQPSTAAPHHSSPGPAGASDTVASRPVLSASSLYSLTKICIGKYYLGQTNEKDSKVFQKKRRSNLYH